MTWVRLTHALTGKPIDVNLSLGYWLFHGNDGTEIQVSQGMFCVVRETPDQIWDGIAKSHADWNENTPYKPFIQIAPVVTLQKTSAGKGRKKR